LKKWNDYIKQHSYKLWLLLFFFAGILVFTYFFLNYAEQRQGVILNDRLLSAIPAVNVSIPLFILTYFGTLFGVAYVIRKPDLTVLTAMTYMLMLAFRMTCMYFTPLEPPVNIIPLRDIFLESTFYSGHVNLKDLFFSGHTATMFMFFMVIGNKKIKILYAIITLAVVCLLLIQHAHYTIDVLVAPVMVWFAYRLATSIQKKSFL
jgi:hypothetical protein